MEKSSKVEKPKLQIYEKGKVVLIRNETVEEIKKMTPEKFEKVEVLDYVYDGFEIEIPFNTKKICSRVEEEIRKEIKQDETYSDEEEEWILSQYPTENEQLIILGLLKEITILKLKELYAKLEIEYLVRYPFCTDEEIEIKEKVLQDVFGKYLNENMADTLLIAWKTRYQEEE